MIACLIICVADDKMLTSLHAYSYGCMFVYMIVHRRSKMFASLLLVHMIISEMVTWSHACSDEITDDKMFASLHDCSYDNIKDNYITACFFILNRGWKMIMLTSVTFLWGKIVYFPHRENKWTRSEQLFELLLGSLHQHTIIYKMLFQN